MIPTMIGGSTIQARRKCPVEKEKRNKIEEQKFPQRPRRKSRYIVLLVSFESNATTISFEQKQNGPGNVYCPKKYFNEKKTILKTEMSVKGRAK